MGREPQAGSAAAPGLAYRLPRVVAAVWLVCLVATAAVSGCPRVTPLYVAYVVTMCAVIGGELIYLNRLYSRHDHSRLPSLRKLTGYAVMAQYVAQAVSRAEWVNAGLIGARRAAFLYGLILLCTAVGSAFLFLLTRSSVRGAFGDPRALRNGRLKASAGTKSKRGALGRVLEWADTLVFAVVAVILINVFVLQIYAVPSESMVPSLLSGDRPVAIKAVAGPRLPLTEYRLPFLRQPARGDIVTIANPRYPDNSSANPRRYLAQFLYMITLTGLNIDKTADDGSPRADPLVKRIVAVPGEKLMMVDDILMVRRADDPEFAPVDVDSERYSHTDLWQLPPAVRSKIGYLPVDASTREMLSTWDARKNGADVAYLSRQLLVEAARLLSRARQIPDRALSAFERLEPGGSRSPAARRRLELIRNSASGRGNPVAEAGTAIDDLALALALTRSPALVSHLERYAAGAANADPADNAYERSCHALNLLIKVNLISRVERDLVLVASEASIAEIAADRERSELLREAKELDVYLNRYFDARNFPEFPSGDRYLAGDEYFAMGDNRYNSLDFRFATQSSVRSLDGGDPYSVRYESAVAPFALKREFIEGYAFLRVWPLSRAGLLR